MKARNAAALLLGGVLSLMAVAGEVSRPFSVTLNVVPSAGQCVGSSQAGSFTGSVELRCSSGALVLSLSSRVSSTQQGPQRDGGSSGSVVNRALRASNTFEPGTSFSVVGNLSSSPVGTLHASVQVFPGILNQDESVEMLVTF